MKTEYPFASLNKGFLFNWYCIAQPFFHCMTVSQLLKRVPSNCKGISGDFLMGIPGISGHIWMNSLNYTAASKDDWKSPISDNCFSFLVASFLDEVEQCWGKWTCTHRFYFRLLTCLLLIFPGSICFCLQLKILTFIPWMTF